MLYNKNVKDKIDKLIKKLNIKITTIVPSNNKYITLKDIQEQSSDNWSSIVLNKDNKL